jgi:hypothetical protein
VERRSKGWKQITTTHVLVQPSIMKPFDVYWNAVTRLRCVLKLCKKVEWLAMLQDSSNVIESEIADLGARSQMQLMTDPLSMMLY